MKMEILSSDVPLIKRYRLLEQFMDELDQKCVARIEIVARLAVPQIRPDGWRVDAIL